MLKVNVPAFFSGSGAQHEAAVTDRTEYGGGGTKHFLQTCLCNHKQSTHCISIRQTFQIFNQSSPADVCAADLAEQVDIGGVLRHRTQPPGKTTGDAAGLVVPPQLQRGGDEGVRTGTSV